MWPATKATLRAVHASLWAAFCATFAPHPHWQAFHRVLDTVRAHFPRIPRAAAAAAVCVDHTLHAEAQRRLARPAAPAAPAAIWGWGLAEGPSAAGSRASGGTGGEKREALGTFGGMRIMLWPSLAGTRLVVILARWRWVTMSKLLCYSNQTFAVDD